MRNPNSPFNQHQQLSEGGWLRKYREENTSGREATNNRADPEYVERRRRLEALLEAKRLKSEDEIDSDWEELWKG